MIQALSGSGRGNHFQLLSKTKLQPRHVNLYETTFSDINFSFSLRFSALLPPKKVILVSPLPPQVNVFPVWCQCEG